MKLPRKGRLPANFLKIFLVLAASANLIALFFFDYGLPEYSYGQEETSGHEESAKASIQFGSNTLSYDGNGDLDELLLDDVTASDADGNDLTASLTAVLKNTGSLSEKEIRYSAKTADGKKLHASRTLRLENYEGPQIDISSNLPIIKPSELDHVISLLSDAGALYAEDGFGNDITSRVKVSWAADETSIGCYILNFSVKNPYQDSTSARTVIQTELEVPVIALTRKEVTIHVGDGFDAEDYFRTAVDIDGSTIPWDLVDLSGHVERETPGIYDVTYSVTGPESGLTGSAVLTVTVEEADPSESDASEYNE